MIVKSSLLLPSNASELVQFIKIVELSTKYYTCSNQIGSPDEIFFTSIYKSESDMSNYSISLSKTMII